MTTSDTTKSTKVISQCHKELDELFLLHQEAVLMGKIDESIQLLNHFVELHYLHVRFKDKQSTLKLVALGDQGRWPASMYIDEHARNVLKKNTVT